jgi:hypothetical protein
MTKSKLWKLITSIMLGLIMSPFIGSLGSNIYIPYAKSDSEISTVFEITTLVSFPVVSGIIFILLLKFFSNKQKIADN